MATLYCYDFDGKNLKEATVEVKETEKQYKAEDTIPFLYKGKLLKSELGLQNGYSRAYVATEPARKAAIEAFKNRTKAKLTRAEADADEYRKTLANLEALG